MSEYPLLSIMTFLPLAGAVLILILRKQALARWLALGTTLATAAVSIPIHIGFDKSSKGLQFVELAPWWR